MRPDSRGFATTTNTLPSGALTMDARRAVERAARDSHGRLVAFLAARSHDVAAAEDALADAFEAALRSWPLHGVPQKPEAWLLTVARRRLIDNARHVRVHTDAAPTLRAAAEEAQELATGMVFPRRAAETHVHLRASGDRRRRAHAAHAADRAGSRRGAHRLRVSRAAHGDGAAARPREGENPRRPHWIRTSRGPGAAAAPRLRSMPPTAAVGTMSRGPIRAAKDWPWKRSDLGRLLLLLMPAEPEAQGLLALMLYCEARRGARRSAAGGYVPLSEQDVTLWAKPMIEEADGLLVAAGQAGRIGRFQLEAAIQSAHARRAATGGTDWESIALLYEELVHLAPTIGALVGRAAAVAEARGAPAGWALLEALPAEAIKTYQPYWALAAHLLRRMARGDEAATACSRAIGLCEDEAAREFLAREAGAD